MLKIAAAGATALCAGILCTTPYSLSVTPQGSVSLSLDRAAARIGHPLTPMSVAGVHRRAMRRTYGVGANLGYHPVARRAAIAAAATGAGYYGAGYGGWGGWGWNRPLFASAGWGWNRPLFASAVGVGGPSVGMGGYGFLGCHPAFNETGGYTFCPDIGDAARLGFGTGQIRQ